MSNTLKISEACSLALHALAYMASEPDRSHVTHEIAQRLGASENHLAKVMQRLVKSGFIHSTRGPGGGFTLVDSPQQITLLDIYQAIEGPLEPPRCLLAHPICDGKQCILGRLIGSVNQQVRDYLAQTSLIQLKTFFPLKESAYDDQPKHS